MSPHNNRPWRQAIDKMSLVSYDPSPANVIASCDRLIDSFENDRFFGAVLKNGQRHRIQLAIPIFEDGSLSGRLLIQAGARFAGIPDYRFEFNPAVLRAAGVNRVLEIIDEIF